MGTPYAPVTLAPDTDDSCRVLALKIAAMFHGASSGAGVGNPPALDDSEQDALYKVASLLWGASQGTVTISF